MLGQLTLWTAKIDDNNIIRNVEAEQDMNQIWGATFGAP